MTQLPLIMLCVQVKDPWFKHSTVLIVNGLSSDITRLFDSFVLRRLMNEGTTFIRKDKVVNKEKLYFRLH